jgi:hypothetical protein
MVKIENDVDNLAIAMRPRISAKTIFFLKKNVCIS